MSTFVRVLLTFIGWAAAVAVVAPVCFVLVVLLAGPHSSMLPSAVQPAILVLGWLVLLVAPLWVARQVWRRAPLLVSRRD
jgi:hypothetical protein